MDEYNEKDALYLNPKNVTVRKESRSKYERRIVVRQKLMLATDDYPILRANIDSLLDGNKKIAVLGYLRIFEAYAVAIFNDSFPKPWKTRGT